MSEKFQYSDVEILPSGWYTYLAAIVVYAEECWQPCGTLNLRTLPRLPFLRLENQYLVCRIACWNSGTTLDGAVYRDLVQ
jgi:hypothetical protein